MTEPRVSGRDDPPGATAGPAGEPDLDRILTIPNAISFGRLLCVPVFLWLLFGRDNRLAAAWLLAFLGATDWVDGFIARRYNQVSTLGKVLDPVADRLLLVVGVVSILIYGAVPAVVAWLAIAREGSVAVLALALAALGARRIDVNWWGKTGTFLLMIAFPLFLLGDGHGAAHAVAWVVSVAGLIAGWYANLLYVPQGLQALREGRARPGRGTKDATANGEIPG
jgi:cardiolipin synthase